MALADKEILANKVNETLTQLRPFLEADGGDITLVDITDDNVVELMLHGACSSCSMSMMTLKNGVEESLKKSAPEITGVKAVNMPAEQV